MLVLEDSIEIGVPPEKVFAFFDGMDSERYRAWHPDHHDFAWEGESGARVGNIFSFDETIGGKRMRKRVQFSAITEDRYLEFVLTNRFLRLILRRLSFAMEPTERGCIFRARIEILTGPLGAWLNSKEFDAVRVHMKEEGEHLKKLAETHSY